LDYHASSLSVNRQACAMPSMAPQVNYVAIGARLDQLTSIIIVWGGDEDDRQRRALKSERL
jgi:hypothetical protein